MILGIGAAAIVATAGASWWMTREPPEITPHIASTRPQRPIWQSSALSTAAQPATPAPRSISDADLTRLATAAFSHTARWTRIPDAIHVSLVTEPGGRVLLSVSGQNTPDTFQKSIEAIAAGGPPILRGGQLLLIDRNGRYWGFSGSDRHNLLCYDGHRWLPPHTGHDSKFGTFASSALAAKNGDAHFVFQYKKDFFLHRCSAAGEWSVVPFPAGTQVDTEAKLVEQAGGRLAFCPRPRLPQGEGVPLIFAQVIAAEHPEMGKQSVQPALLFDSKMFTAFTPPDLPKEKLRANQAVPLPDGSILTIYQGSERVLLSWPAGTSDQVAAQTERLINQLDNPEPGEREAARAALIKLGPSIKDVVARALPLPQNQGPERHEALLDIAQQLSAAAQGENDPSAVLFGGRYKLGGVTPMAYAPDGTLRLFATSIEDHVRDTAAGPGFLTVTPAGEWMATPLPDNPELDTLPASVDSALEDSTGHLWLGYDGERRLDLKTLQFVPGLPAAADYGPPRKADRDGRVFFQNNGDLVICDTTVPEPAPALPTRDTPLRSLSALPGEATAWGIADELMRINEKGELSPGPKMEGLAPNAVEPMHEGAALVWFKSRDRSRRPDDYPMVFDGQNWVGTPAGGPGPLHGWAQTLARVAPRDLRPMRAISSVYLALGSDRGQGAWMHRAFIDPNEFVHHGDFDTMLLYSDGRARYEAFALFEAPAAREARGNQSVHLSTAYDVLGTVEDGRLALVHVPDGGGVWAVAFEGGKLVKRQVPGGELLPPQVADIHAANGHIWWTGFRSPGVWHYADGKITAVPAPGVGLFGDTAGRLWSVDQKTLAATPGGTVTVDDLDERSRIVESPTGRLWLLHGAGLSELLVDGGVRIGRTWPWGAPLNDFRSTFIDSANGLWLGGRSGRVVRISLPQ